MRSDGRKLLKRKLILDLLKNKKYDLLLENLNGINNDKFKIISTLIKNKEKEYLPKFCKRLNIPDKCIIPLWNLIPDINFFKTLRLHNSIKTLSQVIENQIYDLYKLFLNQVTFIETILNENIKTNNLKNITFISEFNPYKFNINCKNLNLNIIIILLKILSTDSIFTCKDYHLIYFIENDFFNKSNSNFLFLAIKSENLPIIKLMYEKNFYLENNICFNKLFSKIPNSIELIKFLISKGIIVDSEILSKSVFENYKITKLFLKNFNFKNIPLRHFHQYNVFLSKNYKIINEFIDLGLVEISKLKAASNEIYINFLEYKCGIK